VRAYELAERALGQLGDDDGHPRIRFQNMRDYPEWLEADHDLLLARWEEWKRERDKGRRSLTMCCLTFVSPDE
jgi:hypothetical protein